MTDVAKVLIGLAAVAFVLAIVTNFSGLLPMAQITTSEGYSRASTNLALLAIALVLCFRNP